MEIKLLCLETLMLMASMTSALPMEATERYHTDDTGRRCRLCPPGQYQADCNKCSDCPPDTFTPEWNSEESCLDCHRDCRKEFNLQVVQKCSEVSDVVCNCTKGYTCKDFDSTMGQCKYCDVDDPVMPALPAELTRNQTETPCAPGTFLNVFSGNCDPQTSSESPTDIPLHSPDTDKQQWGYVILTVFLVISLVMAAIIFMWRHREGKCLKQLFKLCSDGGHKGENEAPTPRPGVAAGHLFSKETHWNANSPNNLNRESHTDPPSSTDQASKVTGNLGPFHIHSAGAVFISLLNHFTNPEGEMEGKKSPQNEETAERGETPPTPPVHLSEEERDTQKDCMFFPLQEQGKESHLSKEEEIYYHQKGK